ncbi:type II asparaginase [Candidatus Margulisiibacteriota bacterium]
MKNKFSTRFFSFCFTCLIIIVFNASLFAAPKKNIVILATGGTIAGTGHSSTNTAYSAGQLSIDQLLQDIPELKNIAKITGEQVCNIASQEMNNEIWLKLARRVNTLVKSPNVEGIVITHGTDTMEETAYFLNLVIRTKKPIVFVGSMRPATALSADGPLNLYNAVVLASNDKSAGKGVLVSLNDDILSAREATKTHTTSIDAFRNRDFGVLGYIIGKDVQFYQQSTRRHTYQSEFNIEEIKEELPKVDIVYGYANNNGFMIEAAVKKQAKGIIHAGTGNGNIFPLTFKALIDARKKDILVVRSSRGNAGIVTRGTEVDDAKHSFITADTLNPQKARILLMLALGKTNEVSDIQRMFDEY